MSESKNDPLKDLAIAFAITALCAIGKAAVDGVVHPERNPGPAAVHDMTSALLPAYLARRYFQ